MDYEENLNIYNEIISNCNRFKRKGKTMPYTSANGYMFSLLNKSGEIGIRFSSATQNEYISKYNTYIFKSYNSIMHGYILITENMLKELSLVTELLNEGYDYVMSLKPK